MNQKVIQGKSAYKELDDFFIKKNAKCILVVCGKSMDTMEIGNYFSLLEKRMDIRVVYFRDFTPNPKEESVLAGIEVYRNNACEAIVAVGGGSAIDVAKVIKIYSGRFKVNDKIPFLAVPTTAGTGSEATKFAVIYCGGEKKSIVDDECIPEIVFLEPSFLKTLSLYQRKATMMDALCHAVEAYWSINSTNESKEYSEQAIKLIVQNSQMYLNNNVEGNQAMLLAAHLAGKAINIAKTTAGHAMSYKITTLYNISHGHAVALCVSEIWQYMLMHTEECIDPRGKVFLKQVFGDLDKILGGLEEKNGAIVFKEFLESLELETPTLKNLDQLDTLAKSVNLERLANNPIQLSTETIRELYSKIFNIV